ncbi:hypothetical protein ACFQFC_39845 [Amorphoplanes digitatis]|uniref:Uncharacterized protein n=1 Tax=Actinoplanes digitatis TaxID=1868 RepID=A0A7W7HWZ6_9ACTN|nr:hypothetical protein [Actinoplanes digitatis]MBB4762328.1 hypothetical protein [Actinoplanes digitatis]BFE71133.1 hypothetical protein GCM10020092_044340 [Actinoplanes digitatis]GID92550.1 hypothetical protein Adi01nite_19620 [Actinoplanes digitatis]
MTTPSHDPDQQPPGSKPERSIEDVMWQRVGRRRDRVHSQVQQARSGRHLVPTWLMATVLGLILLGWLYIIFFD